MQCCNVAYSPLYWNAWAVWIYRAYVHIHLCFVHYDITLFPWLTFITNNHLPVSSLNSSVFFTKWITPQRASHWLIHPHGQSTGGTNRRIWSSHWHRRRRAPGGAPLWKRSGLIVSHRRQWQQQLERRSLCRALCAPPLADHSAQVRSAETTGSCRKVPLETAVNLFQLLLERKNKTNSNNKKQTETLSGWDLPHSSSVSFKFCPTSVLRPQ